MLKTKTKENSFQRKRDAFPASSEGPTLILQQARGLSYDTTELMGWLKQSIGPNPKRRKLAVRYERDQENCV